VNTLIDATTGLEVPTAGLAMLIPDGRHKRHAVDCPWVLGCAVHDPEWFAAEYRIVERTHGAAVISLPCSRCGG